MSGDEASSAISLSRAEGAVAADGSASASSPSIEACGQAFIAASPCGQAFIAASWGG